MKYKLYNLMGGYPVLLRNKDGSYEIVSSLFIPKGDGRNLYVFKYPYEPKNDYGRSVNTNYLFYKSLLGSVYLFFAVKFINKFPKWITF